MAYSFERAYEPFYLSFLAVCLVIAIQVSHRIHYNIGRESVIRSFRRIICVYIIYIAVDTAWVLVSFHTASLAAILFLEYLESGILTYFTFCWFLFAEYYIKGFAVSCRRRVFYDALPVLLSAAITCFYCLHAAGIAGTGTLSDQWLYGVNILADVFYLVFALIHTVVKCLQEKHRIRRNGYYVMMQCMMYPMIGAIASFFISYVPFIILGILPSITKVLIDMQNANIYTDALTRINNRYRVDEYLDHIWEHCSPEHPISIYLLDLNHFKQINDRYGHMEGDRALVVLAESLKQVSYEGLMIGRFGGDEFIMVDADASQDDPDRIIRLVRESLKERVKQERLPFPLTVSAGYAICTSPDESVLEVKKRADALLYKDKKAQESQLYQKKGI